MKSQSSWKSGQIGSLILELHPLTGPFGSFISSPWLKDMDEISDKLENWPDQIINLS